MPGNAIKVLCTRCVPPTSVCSVQQFNLHVMSHHRNEPLQELCAMIDPGTTPSRYTVCQVQGCLLPLYARVSTRAHYNKHHPGIEIPQLPDNEVSATELHRRDLERRRLLQSTAANNNVVSVSQQGTSTNNHVSGVNAANRRVTASTSSAAPISQQASQQASAANIITGPPVRTIRPPGGAFGISRIPSVSNIPMLQSDITAPAQSVDAAASLPTAHSITEVPSTHVQADEVDTSSLVDAGSSIAHHTQGASPTDAFAAEVRVSTMDDTAGPSSSPSANTSADATSSIQSRASPSIMLPSILNPADSSSSSSQVEDGQTNSAHSASDDSVDTATATSSAQVASTTPTRRRSPRLRQLNTNTVAGRRVATVLDARRAPVTADSTATDNVPPVASTATAANNAPAATQAVPRNVRGRPATRRNPALVHVNHNAPPPAVVVANDDDNDRIVQADHDLAVRRRNNIARRNNRRNDTPRGNLDLLPHSVEELVINEDDLSELEDLPDAAFEEHFFGFHHPRLDTIHYTYVGAIQLVVVKLLRLIVENMGLAIPSLVMDRRCRSAITALQCVIMIIRCISIKHHADSTSNSVQQFLAYWNSLPAPELAGSILCYAAKAREYALSSEYRPRVYNSVRSVIAKAEGFMQRTKFSRALSTLDRHLNPLVSADTAAAPATVSRSLAEQRELTSQLHPPHDPVLDNVENAVASDAPTQQRITRLDGIDAASIKKAVNTLDTTASEGIDSWNNFHLKKVLLHIAAYDENDENEGAGSTIQDEIFDLILQLVKFFIAGTFNNASLLSLSRLIYVPKASDPTSLRPIAIGSAWYRLVGNIITDHASEATGALLAPLQIGVGIKDGGGILATMLQGLTSAHPELCILSFDIANAFNTERRGRTAAGVAKYCPVLLPLYQRLYGIEGSSLRNSLGQLVGQSGTGVRQGDPLAMLFFCCSIHDTLVEVNNALKQVMSTAEPGSTLYKYYLQGSYADDLNICLPVPYAEDVFETTMDIFERNGYGLNRNKSTIFLSDRYRGEENRDDVNLFFPRTSQNVVFRKRILGVEFGSNEAVEQSLQAQFSEIQRLLSLLKHVPASIAFYLLKYCVNAIPAYIHRILPPSITQAWFSTAIDTSIVESIEHMLHSTIPATTRILLRLPCKLDGLGITAWHNFVPKVQYDVLQQRSIEFMEKHRSVFGNITEVVSRRREVFSDADLGFATSAVRDYINNTSSKRSFVLHTAAHANFTAFLRDHGREDIITHMNHQRFPGNGLLFGINYIRHSFIKDDRLFSEALAYRLKVPIIIAPDPVEIPPPRPYQCRYCDNQHRRYDIATTLFEHCVSCKCASADVTHRHDATVKAIMNYVRDVRGSSVEVVDGTRENTNGDRGQICDFVILRRGQADVKFDVTYTSGVDAPHLTNLVLPAPLDSIVSAENHKRGHYQRNDNSSGDVIPLAFSFSGYCLGPSFIAFCNTIEAPDANSQRVFDYSAVNGVKFVRDFHPARRRLLCEITRLSYLFIAKARIRCRQQVYRPIVAEADPPVFFPPFTIPPLIPYGQPPVGPWNVV